MSRFFLCVVWAAGVSAAFSKYGCFASADVASKLTQKDQFTYQSSGHCTQECAGSSYAALTDGSFCYCGDISIDSSKEVDISNCDTPCQGYNIEDCGGDGYFLVYQDPTVPASSAASSESSSSTSSSSGSSSSSSSSSASSRSRSSSASSASAPASSNADSTSASSPDSAQGAATTVVSTTIGSAAAVETTITKTASPTSSSASADSSSSAAASGSGNSEDSSASLSGGAIAGIVVGSVAGVGLLGLLAFLFLWSRRRNDNNAEDYDEKNDQFSFPGAHDANGASYNVGPNPFMAAGNGTARSQAHKRNLSSVGNTANSYSSNNEDLFVFDNPAGEYLQPANEEFGRRRLSDGSLPDMVTKGSLKVVNN